MVAQMSLTRSSCCVRRGLLKHSSSVHLSGVWTFNHTLVPQQTLQLTLPFWNRTTVLWGWTCHMEDSECFVIYAKGQPDLFLGKEDDGMCYCDDMMKWSGSVRSKPKFICSYHWETRIVYILMRDQLLKKSKWISKKNTYCVQKVKTGLV
jgi:hypothetical protein